jgi:DNA-binding response OmpR family regulator
MSATTIAAQPKILIADDNPHGVELLEAYLGDAPFDIRTATNGEETLTLIKEWRPDVLLLDIMMPKLSGFEVCKWLRSQPELRDVGVLMVTALDQPSDVERAVDAGTDDFLTKPINKAELLLRIRALLAAPRKQDDIHRMLAYFQAVEQASR